MDTRKLRDRVAFVTGASRGIGAAAAVALAAEGAHVVLVGRTVGGLEETDDAIRAVGGTASLLPLDLAAPDKIEQAAAALFDRYGRLDVLVANAAHPPTLTPAHQMKERDWDTMLTVTLKANWRLIRAFDPLLRAAPAGRAIFVTCGAAEGQAYWGAYAVAKAGLETLARTWAAELAKTTVRVNLLDPGPVATRLRERAYPGEDANRLATPADVAPLFVELALPDGARHGETVRAP